MISYSIGLNKFQYRAASVIIHNNKVLLQRQSHNDLWFIPGGRVEFNETAERTIEREMEEEFGVNILNKSLIWIVENFTQFPDLQVHEIGLFFLVTLPEDHSIYFYENEFAGVEDGFVNKWVHMDNLNEYNIIPEFIVPELRCLDVSKEIKHVINRGVR